MDCVGIFIYELHEWKGHIHAAVDGDSGNYNGDDGNDSDGDEDNGDENCAVIIIIMMVVEVRTVVMVIW